MWEQLGVLPSTPGLGETPTVGLSSGTLNLKLNGHIIRVREYAFLTDDEGTRRVGRCYY